MKYFFFFVLCIIVKSQAKVAVTYNNQDYEACSDDSVEVTWDGYHNLQETTKAGYASCASSEFIGSEIASYHNANYKESFNIGASSGKTRYFICVAHCYNNKKFKTTCTEKTTTTTEPTASTTTTEPIASTSTSEPIASTTTAEPIASTGGRMTVNTAIVILAVILSYIYL